MRGLTVAVAGATGVVGCEFLRLLEERNFPVARLRAMASARSAGGTVAFCGADCEVEDLGRASFEGVDVAFFSAGGDVSREHAPRAAAAGAVVVDNSSAFRMDPDVPLVVPQVNPDALKSHRGIIANPNCSTIILVMALAPIERALRGRAGRLRDVPGGVRERRSCDRGVGGAGPSGCGGRRGAGGGVSEAHPPERPALRPGLRRGRAHRRGVEDDPRDAAPPRPAGSATHHDLCAGARAPRTQRGAQLELRREASPEEVRACLAEAEGVRVLDDPAALAFPTPRDAEGGDDVWVGRIRRDPSHPQGIDLWLVGDQIRKGAALNAVEIAERLFGVGAAAPAPLEPRKPIPSRAWKEGWDDRPPS